MSIPTKDSTGADLPDNKKLYVCGTNGTAYRVKNATTAKLFEPFSYTKLTTAQQGFLNAYDVNVTIAAEEFNPNSGENSQYWTKKEGGYAQGKLVTMDNNLWRCESKDSCGTTDPGDNDTTVWSVVTNERVPPSSLVREEDYNEKTPYTNLDLAIKGDVIYRCTAPDTVIGTETTNDCQVNDPSTVNDVEIWKPTSLKTDRAKPIDGGPFVADYNYKKGDYYADTVNNKVYQCSPTNGYLGEMGCRQPFSATNSAWSEVAGAAPIVGAAKIK